MRGGGRPTSGSGRGPPPPPQRVGPPPTHPPLSPPFPEAPCQGLPPSLPPLGVMKIRNAFLTAPSLSATARLLAVGSFSGGRRRGARDASRPRNVPGRVALVPPPPATRACPTGRVRVMRPSRRLRLPKGGRQQAPRSGAVTGPRTPKRCRRSVWGTANLLKRDGSWLPKGGRRRAPLAV